LGSPPFVRSEGKKLPPVRGPTAYRFTGSAGYNHSILVEKTQQKPPPKGGGLTQEFARIFAQLFPQAQTEIIAEMLKRKRQEQ
jgi:hypothetical protein